MDIRTVFVERFDSFDLRSIYPSPLPANPLEAVATGRRSVAVCVYENVWIEYRDGVC